MSLTDMRQTLKRLTSRNANGANGAAIHQAGFARQAGQAAGGPIGLATGGPVSLASGWPGSRTASRSRSQMDHPSGSRTEREPEHLLEALPAGSMDIYVVCDHFIEQCKAAILKRDVQMARDVRNQATHVFENIIPGWHQALMGQFTGYYLDDAEMILAKLGIFRANRDARKPLDYVNLTRAANRIITVHEAFERVLAEAGSEPVLTAADFPGFKGMLCQLQTILESPLTMEDRWERARPFLLWATTLEAPLARHVMPLLNYSVR